MSPENTHKLMGFIWSAGHYAYFSTYMVSASLSCFLLGSIGLTNQLVLKSDLAPITSVGTKNTIIAYLIKYQVQRYKLQFISDGYVNIRWQLDCIAV